jgi:peptidoglycan hydrolase-like protein with peptidoglycan-binding domain
MQVVCRKFTHAEFESYVKSLPALNWAKFVVVHNTSVPDIRLYRDDWMKRPSNRWTPEIWLRNLTSHYANKGWKGGPHLFIPPAPDQILVLNDLRVPGTHSPSWNKFSIGVEVVGEFEREPFQDPIKANLLHALKVLHEKLGVQPLPYERGGDTVATAGRGLHFHREDPETTHRTCPGKNLNKAQLVADLTTMLGGTPPPVEDHSHDVPVASQEAATAGVSIQELTSIKWLQQALNAWCTKNGRPFELLTMDGVRGGLTTNATRVFQQRNNLVVDGIAGPVTRTLLKKLTA